MPAPVLPEVLRVEELRGLIVEVGGHRARLSLSLSPERSATARPRSGLETHRFDRVVDRRAPRTCRPPYSAIFVASFLRARAEPAPPFMPAATASSFVHSCAVPFACAALPPSEQIARRFSGVRAANPR